MSWTIRTNTAPRGAISLKLGQLFLTICQPFSIVVCSSSTYVFWLSILQTVWTRLQTASLGAVWSGSKNCKCKCKFTPTKTDGGQHFSSDNVETFVPVFDVDANGVVKSLKSYAHQRETTGLSSDSLQLLPLSKKELLLKERNCSHRDQILPLWAVP